MHKTKLKRDEMLLKMRPLIWNRLATDQRRGVHGTTWFVFVRHKMDRFGRDICKVMIIHSSMGSILTLKSFIHVRFVVVTEELTVSLQGFCSCTL